MDALQRTRLVRQRAVAKASLTRLQSFIDTGKRKLKKKKSPLSHVLHQDVFFLFLSISYEIASEGISKSR